ncbi:MAG: hypothetical protein IJ779_11655 [Ruminococcus sp.]|nr:hypothetical protein [Ruminococcus sp.]
MKESLQDEQLKKVKRMPLIIAAIVVLVAALFFFFLIRGYSNDPYKKTKFSESDRAVISSAFDLENNSFELDTMTYVNENNSETYNVFVKTNDIEQFGETYGLKKWIIIVWMNIRIRLKLISAA